MGARHQLSSSRSVATYNMRLLVIFTKAPNWLATEKRPTLIWGQELKSLQEFSWHALRTMKEVYE
jgi:hypothetical protein